jgi:NADPH:quinone reductase-like Zn-dependent oxidoreductase
MRRELAGGAHTSHVVVPQDFLLPAPDDADPTALAVLPYSFTTMCSRCVRPGSALATRAAPAC